MCVIVVNHPCDENLSIASKIGPFSWVWFPTAVVMVCELWVKAEEIQLILKKAKIRRECRTDVVFAGLQGERFQ